MPQKRISYFYDGEYLRLCPSLDTDLTINATSAADVGSYSFGFGHYMKPQRVRMTHDLLTAYGMLDKMKVVVRTALQLLCHPRHGRSRPVLQRPRRCSPEGMTAFHTDEYVDFLTKVTPETAFELTSQWSRCKWAISVESVRSLIFDAE